MRTYNIYHFQYKKKRKSPYIILNLHLWDFFIQTHEFETTVVNKPSVFELLKVYYTFGGRNSAYFNYVSFQLGVNF